MVDTATARRKPSPHPRPTETAVDERPTLRVVPPPPADPDPAEPATGNLQPEAGNTPTSREESSQVNSVPGGADGANPPPETGRIAGFTASVKAVTGRAAAYWTPPALLTEQPASLADLADYAAHAPWTAQERGAVRKAGVVYWSGLALPYTTVSRYREWVVQRPGRLVAHLAAIKVLSLTTPGIWVVDHLVYPVARLAGHVFL